MLQGTVKLYQLNEIQDCLFDVDARLLKGQKKQGANFKLHFVVLRLLKPGLQLAVQSICTFEICHEAGAVRI